MHFSRSWPSNSWWQTMVGWQVLSRPSAAEGGGRRTAFTGRATQPYSTTEVDGWQHELSRVSQNRAAVHEGTTGHPAHDAEKYKWRHLVENFFCALKAFRRIATRYEKTDTCFAAMINLVAAVLWTR